MLSSLLSLVTIPSYAQQVKPLCYVIFSNGNLVSLDYLCNKGQNQVTQKIDKDLQLVNVASQQSTEYGDAITVITGSIKNNTTKEINYPSLAYTTYRKISEGLIEQESDKKFTKRLTLRPGESSNFEVKLTKIFDVFMVNYLDSVQVQNVGIKSCYANGVESSGYCNLLSPLSIQRFK